MNPPPFDPLYGVSADYRAKVLALATSGELMERLRARYPEQHGINNNALLYAYVQDLKKTFLKSSDPLGKVRYSDKISALHRALGLQRKNELRVCSRFKELPPEFLRMVVVHELAHLRHRDHDKAFYRLCTHMEPEYHRYELDLRLWLFAESHGPA
jgi:predicted metal-dependent hydrolase